MVSFNDSLIETLKTNLPDLTSQSETELRGDHYKDKQAMAETKETHQVPTLKEPVRLSDYVPGIFKSISSKKGMKKAIQKKLVFIDGRVGFTSNYINGGETITLLEEEVQVPITGVSNLGIEVLFEDDHLAIVSKPAGLVVSGNQKRTLYNALPHILEPSSLIDAAPLPDPIHRLDFPTSGILLVGKTRSTITALNRLFEKREVEKIYYAVTVGKMKNKTKKISTDIKGKSAITKFEVKGTTESDKYGGLNLVKLSPITGRKHQLRVHLTEYGNPILGDQMYFKEGLISKGKGLYLHGYSLKFDHPVTGEKVHIKKAPPAKFEINGLPKIKG